jgi:hypothetical protein
MFLYLYPSTGPKYLKHVKSKYFQVHSYSSELQSKLKKQLKKQQENKNFWAGKSNQVTG